MEQRYVNLSIRYGTAADNILLADFGRRAFSDTFSHDNTPADMAAYLASAFSPEKQASELADTASIFLIAEIAEQMVGFARLLTGTAPAFIEAEKPVELVRIYADKKWVGRGIGSALLQRCLVEGARRNCDVIWLGVWERNEHALAFYLRWGFMVVGSQDFLLGSDLQTDLVLTRSLTT